MLVIISPAKALDCSTAAKVCNHTLPQFLNESSELVKVLKKKSTQGIQELMGVSNSIAQLNHERFQEWEPPFTPDNAKQAILTFKGDVYKSFDVDSLNPADLQFAQKHLYILSGLYGLLRVLDLIQPYRLEMGIRWGVGQWKNLYQFWDDKISDQLNTVLSKDKASPVLVNLASNEYYKVVKPEKINASIITPMFKERKGSDYKIIGFVAKKARGLMSRHIVKNRIQDVEDLKQFSVEGYRYRPRMSDERTWTFARG